MPLKTAQSRYPRCLRQQVSSRYFCCGTQQGDSSNIKACWSAAAEVDTAQDAAVVVYRMACSTLPTTPETIATDMNIARSAFLESQDAIVAQVGDANRNAALFKDICLPAMDADHLELDLPLDEV